MVVFFRVEGEVQGVSRVPGLRSHEDAGRAWGRDFGQLAARKIAFPATRALARFPGTGVDVQRRPARRDEARGRDENGRLRPARGLDDLVQLADVQQQAPDTGQRHTMQDATVEQASDGVGGHAEVGANTTAGFDDTTQG